MSGILDPSKLKVAELRAELQARGLDAKGNKPVLIERLREALEAEDGSPTEEVVPSGEAAPDPEPEAEPEPEPEPEPESRPRRRSTATPKKKSPEPVATPRKKTPEPSIPEVPEPKEEAVPPKETTPPPQKIQPEPTPSPQKPASTPSPQKLPEPVPSPQKAQPEPVPSPQKTPVSPQKSQPPTVPSPQKPVPSPEKAQPQPTPSPQKPAAASPQKPAAASPQKPAAASPQKPAAASPQKPAAASPQKPAAASPQKPAAASPQKPAAASPQKPAAASPQKPAAASPQKPAAASPQKPAAASPQKPAAASPQKPAAASPQKPAAASPQKPTPSPQKVQPEPATQSTPSPQKTVSPQKSTPLSQSEPAAVVKEEPEDLAKLGYEEAPVEDVDVKMEQDNGYEADVKQEELVEPKTEPMEDDEEEGRRGEKRSHSRSRSPDPKKARPEVEELRVEDEPEMDKTVVALDWYNSDLSLIIDKENYLSAKPLTMQGFGYVWHGVRATYGFTRGRVFYEAKVEEHLPVPQLGEEEKHPHVLRVGWSVDEAGLTLGEDPLSYGYGGTGMASTNLRFKHYGKPFGSGDVLGIFLDMESEPMVMSFTLNGEHLGIAYEIQHSELGDRAFFPHIVTKNSTFKVNFGTEDPWFEPLTGYTFVGKIPLEDRVLGTQGPEKREDAEIIMMVGLPASGKTTWVDNYCKENKEKKYNVLGTNSLIDKMKVNGLPRRRNYSGRWEVLIERCTRCLNKLLELAYKRRRNFIIDQTNVYPSAQRRKMKGFAGFKRRAVVICPTDEDLKKRTEKREREEGKDVPDKAVLEMKANFKLPEEGDLFDSVEFVEQQREEALKLVEQYNKEGEDAGFGQKKGFRGGFGDRRGGFMDRRGGYGNRGGSFRGAWDRDRRGGYNDRRNDRGGWNRDRMDNRDYNRGGYSRDARGGFNRDNRGGFNRDNRGGFNRERGSRSMNYQGNWNRNSSYDNKSTTTSSTTNPWANQQGNQGNQGFGNYGSYGNNQGWGNQNWNSQGYAQGYGNNWNQQYYPQQQQQQQQQQQYWGQGYSYGNQQSYGSNQSYGPSSNTNQTSNWGQQNSNWGNSSQPNQQAWGTGYGYQNQSYNQRR